MSLLDLMLKPLTSTIRYQRPDDTFNGLKFEAAPYKYKENDPRIPTAILAGEAKDPSWAGMGATRQDMQDIMGTVQARATSPRAIRNGRTGLADIMKEDNQYNAWEDRFTKNKKVDDFLSMSPNVLYQGYPHEAKFKAAADVVAQAEGGKNFNVGYDGYNHRYNGVEGRKYANAQRGEPFINLKKDTY